MIKPVLIASLFLITACTFQRSMVASDAQTKMVGLKKEQVLACMGTPVSKATEGQTEVWTYNSGNGSATVSTFATVNPNARFGSAFSTSEQHYCIVSVVMSAIAGPRT